MEKRHRYELSVKRVALYRGSKGVLTVGIKYGAEETQNNRLLNWLQNGKKLFKIGRSYEKNSFHLYNSLEFYTRLGIDPNFKLVGFLTDKFRNVVYMHG